MKQYVLRGRQSKNFRPPGDQVYGICALLVLNVPVNDVCLLCLLWSIGGCILTPLWYRIALLIEFRFSCKFDFRHSSSFQNKRFNYISNDGLSKGAVCNRGDLPTSSVKGTDNLILFINRELDNTKLFINRGPDDSPLITTEELMIRHCSKYPLNAKTI
jgi:hypothetical protein